jgi:hypothetical protein
VKWLSISGTVIDKVARTLRRIDNCSGEAKFARALRWFVLHNRADAYVAKKDSERRASLIVTLEINSSPTLVFEAVSGARAPEICSHPEFRPDLATLTSDGAPICPADACLRLRQATNEEIAVLRRAVEQAPPSNEPAFAFLINVDDPKLVRGGSA